ncbi:hypothetical protein Tco_1034405 [Tanacetum coccineum]
MQQDGMGNGRSYAKAVVGEKPKNVEQVQEMRSMIIEKKELTGLTDVSSTILEEGEVLFADEDESNSHEIRKVYVKMANMAAI